MKTLVTLMLLSPLAFGCAAPTIDSSSDEAFESSMAAVREALPEDEKERFDAAIMDLAFSTVSLEDIMKQGRAADVDLLGPRIRDVLAGKSADEVFEAARLVREERERKEREQALQEITELAERATAARKAHEALSAFVVSRSRFEQQKRRFSTRAVIDLTVKNGTEHPVSRAYFRGTVSSPGRSVPWIQDDFSYSIPGGLEPGEEATWSLSPLGYEWDTEVPADAIFTVEVVRLDGADEEALFDAAGLSEYEQARLEQLREKFGS